MPRKTAATILCFLLFLHILNTLGHVRRFAVASVLDFQPRKNTIVAQPEPVKTVAATRHAGVLPVETPVVAKPSFAELSDPSHALEPFYRALQRAENGRGFARVLHYGDSPVTADSITSDLRDLLQERYGDGGHGFVLIAKPWAWYNHKGVEISSLGWRAEPATQEARSHDGMHGIGGVAFEGGPGAWSTLRLASDHQSVEVAFLKQPLGGTFTVQAGGVTLGSVNTESTGVRADWAKFSLPESSREIRITVDSGAVRLFGASFEKGGERGHGLIYNSLGLNGGQVQSIVRYFDRSHWTAELQHARPDLVVVNYGTNESVFPKYLETRYPDELREVIERIREAVPDASILLMSPMDRGEKGPTGEITTMPAIPRVVEIQRGIAAEMGCAFFNTFQAMGGVGTMGRWYANQPQLVTADFIHPFPAGARKIGMLVNDALASGYERFKSSHPPVLKAEHKTKPGNAN